MFWIGLIAGIVLTFVVSFAYIVYCFKVCGVTYDEYVGMRDLNTEALLNRKSHIQVFTDDGHILGTVTLEEK